MHPVDVAALTDSVDEQLRRTVIAWSLVATPGSTTVSGCNQPWGLDLARVAAIQTAVTTLNAGALEPMTRRAGESGTDFENLQ